MQRLEGRAGLLAAEKAGHECPATLKNYRNKPSSVETVVSLRIKSISNLSVLLHCFVATEKVRKIILAFIMTPSSFINLILRELCEIKF